MGIYLALLLMAGIVAMDTTSGPQVLVSEPIVSCSALGLLFGNPEMGLMLGIVFQLLWLGYLPLGGERSPDNNLAAFISSASLFSAARIFSFEGIEIRAALIPIMLYGVFIGLIGLHIRNFERRINGIQTETLLSGFERGEYPSIMWRHFAGISSAFLKGAIMALLFVPVGIMICWMIRYLPLFYLESMYRASFIIWGAVSASAILFFWANGKPKFIIAGSVSGFIWILFMMVQKG
ncbi:MAG TPA: hypothetical protein ENH82_03205 [bacterium]|nr:hypothetical protein [bacterium]